MTLIVTQQDVDQGIERALGKKFAIPDPFGSEGGEIVDVGHETRRDRHELDRKLAHSGV